MLVAYRKGREVPDMGELSTGLACRNECGDLENNLIQSCQTCSGYIECINGTGYDRKCNDTKKGKPTVWNDDKKLCNTLTRGNNNSTCLAPCKYSFSSIYTSIYRFHTIPLI